MASVCKKDLQLALEHFHTVTGLKIVLYDVSRNIVAAHPHLNEPYCTTVRTSKELCERCLACDERGFDICEQTHAPYIYRCHMGITEAIAPIVSGELILGYLMFGQVLCCGEVEEAFATAVQTAEAFGLDASCLSAQLKNMRQATEEYLTSALHIMCLCAGYLYTNEILKNGSEVLLFQIKEYIRSHIAEELCAEGLCRRFFISRSRLYHLSQEAFGMGIMEYIRERRLTLAKRKLTETVLPIAQVAAEVGYPDVNYFIRVFKSATGLTPRRYREAKHP